MAIAEAKLDLVRPHTIAASVLRWGATVLVLLSYAPLMTLHFRRLWANEYYRYFPLVLLAFVLLTWQRCLRPDETPPPKLPPKRGWIALSLGWLLLASAVLLWSPWLAAVSAIVTVGGLLRQHSSRAGRALSAWLLLWLMIPLPFRWDSKLVFAMQGFASQAGSSLLDFLGYEHLLTGHVIEVPNQQFLVEEACSGVRSLFVLFALTAVFAVWRRRPLGHTLLLLMAAAFWALTVNVIRVSSVVIYFEHGSVDISAGLSHQFLGSVLFVVALLILFFTDVLLALLLEPIPMIDPDGWDDEDKVRRDPDHDDPVSAGEASNSRIKSLSTAARIAVIGATVMFVLLGLTQTIAIAFGSRETKRVWSGRDLDLSFTSETLPEQVQDWHRDGFQWQEREPQHTLGKWSATWSYRSDDSTASVSFDYPFVGWHHLVGCYEAQGWTVRTQEAIVLAAAEDPLEAPLVQVELARPGGAQALLLCSQFDAHGRPLPPPGTAGISSSSWYYALRDRLHKRMTEVGFDLSTYQTQLLVTGDAALSENQRQSVIEAFLEVRVLLHQRLVQSAEHSLR
jgi:exosortase